MSVIAPDVNTVLNWSNISYQDWKLVKKFLRGTTTIILPVKEGIVHPSILGKDGYPLDRTLRIFLLIWVYVGLYNNNFCKRFWLLIIHEYDQ